MTNESTTRLAEISTTNEIGHIGEPLIEMNTSLSEPKPMLGLKANPDATKAAAAFTAEASTETETKSSTRATDTLHLPTVYFTDGELLPLKNYWFKVQLREIDGEKLVTLVKGKPTAAAVKRVEREARWLHQHPHNTSTHVKSLLRSLLVLRSAQA